MELNVERKSLMQKRKNICFKNINLASDAEVRLIVDPEVYESNGLIRV